jgi:hypothetical protein
VVYGTGERGLEGDGALRGASAWGATRCGRRRSFDWRTIALGAMAVGAMPGGVTGGILHSDTTKQSSWQASGMGRWMDACVRDEGLDGLHAMRRATPKARTRAQLLHRAWR